MLALNTVYEMDVIEGLKRLPEKSVNLFIIDPPYYRVKGDFDFVLTWDEWLALHERLAVECKRVMAENGTLFLWGHAKNIAYQQIIFDKYFNLENNLVWEKMECQTKRQDFEQARCFAPVTERALMYSNEVDMTGLEFIEKEYVAPRNPFAIELKEARLKLGISINAVAETGKFYGNVNHGGAVTNWERGYNTPSKEQWGVLCEHLPIKRREYEDLRREYEDLRQEYEHLRRPFSNSMKYTDVLTFSQESHITSNYDHETKKPEGLTTTIIETCSRPNDIVCAPFAGSGTEVAMAAKLGRRWIGFDNVSAYVKMANDRANKMANKIDVTKPIRDTNDYSTLSTGLFAQI